MKPIQKVRLSDKIIDAVKEMIEEDGFEPGDKFYSENELTSKLGVSRSSVREAVRIMEATGWVSVKHGKGIFIADSARNELDAFQDWLKDNESSIIDHFEVRMIIDPKAAAYAALKADKNDIRKMEEACIEFEGGAESGNTASLIKSDERFHELLAKSTKNRTLYYLMKTMTTSLPDAWISSLHVPGRIEKTVIEHRGILEAIKKRDAEKAESAMSEHINNALTEIKKSMLK